MRGGRGGHGKSVPNAKRGEGLKKSKIFEDSINGSLFATTLSCKLPKPTFRPSPGDILVDFLWQEVDLAAGVAAARRVEQFHEGQNLEKGKGEYNRWLRSKSYIKIMVPIEKQFFPSMHAGKTTRAREQGFGKKCD